MYHFTQKDFFHRNKCFTAVGFFLFNNTNTYFKSFILNQYLLYFTQDSTSNTCHICNFLKYIYICSLHLYLKCELKFLD